jgi:hypothetical protein
MNNDQTKGRTPYERMIVEAFHHNFTNKSAKCSTQLRKAGACDFTDNWLGMDSAAA